MIFKGSSTCTLEIYFPIVWGDFVIHMCSIIFRFDMDLGLEKIYWREKNRRKNEIWWNLMKSDEIWWNLMKSWFHQISSNFIKFHQISSNFIFLQFFLIFFSSTRFFFKPDHTFKNCNHKGPQGSPNAFQIACYFFNPFNFDSIALSSRAIKEIFVMQLFVHVFGFGLQCVFLCLFKQMGYIIWLVMYYHVVFKMQSVK